MVCWTNKWCVDLIVCTLTVGLCIEKSGFELRPWLLCYVLGQDTFLCLVVPLCNLQDLSGV